MFRSFDQLNYRFDQLIRNIPLHLKYQHTQKLLFDEFCQKIVSNPELKEQIYSLNISNENSCNQIGRFLSWFSLDEFPHLQVISLGHVRSDDVTKLNSTLPLLSKLIDFRSITYADPDKEVLSAVPISQLHRLSVRGGVHNIEIFYEPSTITHLTFTGCSLHTVFNILKNLPLLKFLNIHEIFAYDSRQPMDSLETFQLVHLKRMLLISYDGTFDNFELIMHHTPNLQHFTITSDNDTEIINASRWESFIRSSLPRLSVFNFEFYYTRQQNVLGKFKRFQRDFWLKEHQWCIDYGFNDHYAIIQTIPSIRDEYRLSLYSIKYQLKKLNTFKNVKELDLCYESVTNQYEYYFPNVTSLILRRQWKNSNLPSSEQILEFLPSIVNLSNLEYLSISHLSVEHLIIILMEILKQAPKLSSLLLEDFDVKSFFKNNEICKYLNTMIRKLDGNYYEFSTLNEVQQFCEIFSNIKQFKYYSIYEGEHLLYLLNNLSNLSLLEIDVPACDNSQEFISWFNKLTLKSDMKYHIKELPQRIIYHTDHRAKNFCVWIERK